MSCTFSPAICLFNAELQSHVGFFEKTSVGPRYGGVLTGYRRKNAQKVGNNSVKKGAKFLLPTIFLCSLDSEFNVDFDFAIKSDLII